MTVAYLGIVLVKEMIVDLVIKMLWFQKDQSGGQIVFARKVVLKTVKIAATILHVSQTVDSFIQPGYRMFD